MDALMADVLNHPKLREALGGLANQTQPPNPFPVREVDPPISVRGRLDLDISFPADTVYTNGLEQLKQYVYDVMLGQTGSHLPGITMGKLELWREVQRDQRGTAVDWAGQLRAATGPDRGPGEDVAGGLSGLQGRGRDADVGGAGDGGAVSHAGRESETGHRHVVADPGHTEHDADGVGDGGPDGSTGTSGAGQHTGGPRGEAIPQPGRIQQPEEPSQGGEKAGEEGWIQRIEEIGIAPPGDPFEGIEALLREEKERLAGG